MSITMTMYSAKINWRQKEKEMVDNLNQRVFSADPLIKKYVSEMSHIDYYNDSYVVELKYRNMPSTQYGDCFIQQDKYQWLMESGARSGKVPGYIAAWSDGVYCAWNLKNLTDKGFDFNWQLIPMNKAIAFKNNSKVDKPVSKLRLENGKILFKLP